MNDAQQKRVKEEGKIVEITGRLCIGQTDNLGGQKAVGSSQVKLKTEIKNKNRVENLLFGSFEMFRIRQMELTVLNCR